eukprot:scaffold157293_cov46-Prasinocladus_malaysianus.AAC.4
MHDALDSDDQLSLLSLHKNVRAGLPPCTDTKWLVLGGIQQDKNGIQSSLNVGEDNCRPAPQARWTPFLTDHWSVYISDDSALPLLPSLPMSSSSSLPCSPSATVSKRCISQISSALLVPSYV